MPVFSYTCIFPHTHTHRLTYYTQSASQRCRKERWRRWKKILFLHVLTFRRRSSSGFVFVTLCHRSQRAAAEACSHWCAGMFFEVAFLTQRLWFTLLVPAQRLLRKSPGNPTGNCLLIFFSISLPIMFEFLHIHSPCPRLPHPSLLIPLSFSSSLALHASATTGAGYLWNNPAVMCLLRPNLPPLMTTG